MGVPSGKEQQRIAALVEKAAARTKPGQLKPQYLPHSVSSLCFSLVAVNGTSTSDDGLCDGSNPFDFSISTSGSDCSTASDPTTASYTCAVTNPAPAANDRWTIVATGNGNTYSESNVTISVPAGGTATGSFSLNPVAVSGQWVVGTQTAGGTSPDVPITTPFANGGGTPFWDGSGYSCPHPALGGCYEPILDNDGVALYDTASFRILDAANNVIIPAATGQTVSGAPNVPIYLDLSGNEEEVYVKCINEDTEWINSGVSAASLPIAQANLVTSGGGNQLANGFYNAPFGSSFTAYLTGPGNTLTGDSGATITGFNSPLNGHDDATVGKGTSFSGTPIVDGIYGDNGTFINYDGALLGGPFPVGTPPSPSSYCTMWFQSPSGTSSNARQISDPNGHNVLNLGLAEGNITWGSNGRHHRSNARSKE
ncbi:MAG: hypothetical protein JO199_10610 [Candidatus Eremiobacteraeota bacterium]|nr:hypothetical protein [Candidatus Eremiobacteraeota bacterium]